MKKISDFDFYSLADAKKDFSSVVNICQSKDVVITKNGKPAVVVVDFEKYQKLNDALWKIYDLYLVDVGSKEDFDIIKELNVADFLDICVENDYSGRNDKN